MNLLVRFLLLFCHTYYDVHIDLDEEWGYWTQPYKVLFDKLYNIGSPFPDTPEHWNCRCVSTLEEETK
jgi:hypothetical protein